MEHWQCEAIQNLIFQSYIFWLNDVVKNNK